MSKKLYSAIVATIILIPSMYFLMYSHHVDIQIKIQTKSEIGSDWEIWYGLPNYTFSDDDIHPLIKKLANDNPRYLSIQQSEGQNYLIISAKESMNETWIIQGKRSIIGRAVETNEFNWSSDDIRLLDGYDYHTRSWNEPSFIVSNETDILIDVEIKLIAIDPRFHCKRMVSGTYAEFNSETSSVHYYAEGGCG